MFFSCPGSVFHNVQLSFSQWLMAFPPPGIMLHFPGRNNKKKQAQGDAAILSTFQKHFWEFSAQALSIFLIVCKMAIPEQSPIVDKEKRVVNAGWILYFQHNSVAEEGPEEGTKRKIGRHGMTGYIQRIVDK